MSNSETDAMEHKRCSTCGELVPYNQLYRHLPCESDSEQTEVGDYE